MPNCKYNNVTASHCTKQENRRSVTFDWWHLGFLSFRKGEKIKLALPLLEEKRVYRILFSLPKTVIENMIKLWFHSNDRTLFHSKSMIRAEFLPRFSLLLAIAGVAAPSKPHSHCSIPLLPVGDLLRYFTRVTCKSSGSLPSFAPFPHLRFLDCVQTPNKTYKKTSCNWYWWQTKLNDPELKSHEL